MAAQPEPTAPRVLVADDDPINRRLAQKLLQRAGVDARVVDHGRAALEALAVEHFDLVLLDMQMPFLNGPETAACIRRGDAGTCRAGTVLLALTGYEGEQEHRCCVDAGMDGVLVKPLRMDALEPWLTGKPGTA